MIKIYNSLTRKIEEFKPINEQQVGFYSCGPTTYDFVHIGNLRTFIFEDILQRTLEANGYLVKRIMNITDIDDKIIRGAKVKGLDIKRFSAPYEESFFSDLRKLNIKSANVYPKATEHIGHILKYIQELIRKQFAYIEKDGSVYFDISKFPSYGMLSGVKNRKLKSGTRVLSDEYSKDNVQDFALWKSVKTDEVGYASPWGRGRPGWHIECSVMSQEYLVGGEIQTIDIHAGGVDLLFPHHENEIAQAEAKTSYKFANFFVEGEHLLVNGQKMAKSAGNFYKISDLEEKGFDPLSFRYLCLTANYMDKLNFTWESLKAAQNAINNLRDIIREWSIKIRASEQYKEETQPIWQRFMQSVNHNLNTPQAIASLWEMVHSNTPTSGKSTVILEMDKILGLELEKYLGMPLKIPDEILRLIEKREKVRQSGDFKASDKFRREIRDLGFEIEDTPGGPRAKPAGNNH